MVSWRHTLWLALTHVVSEEVRVALTFNREQQMNESTSRRRLVFAICSQSFHLSLVYPFERLLLRGKFEENERRLPTNEQKLFKWLLTISQRRPKRSYLDSLFFSFFSWYYHHAVVALNSSAIHCSSSFQRSIYLHICKSYPFSLALFYLLFSFLTLFLPACSSAAPGPSV